jgi:hypothetical protein
MQDNLGGVTDSQARYVIKRLTNMRRIEVMNTWTDASISTVITEGKQQFYTRIKNIIRLELTQQKINLLNHGINYSVERKPKTYASFLVAEKESAIRLLDTKIQSTYR